MGDQYIKGKDHAIEIVVDGRLLGVIDAVTRFTADPSYDTVNTKVLGKAGQYIEKIPIGWSGEVEIKARGPEVEDLIDAYNAAQRARLPIVINITESTTYPNGSRRRWLYPACEIEIGKTVARGELTNYRWRWETGAERIPA